MSPLMSQWVPVIVMIMAILSGVLYNNVRLTDFARMMDGRLNDLRELIKAESGRVEATLKLEFKTEIARVETSLGAQIASVRSDISRLEQRIERLEKERRAA